MKYNYLIFIYFIIFIKCSESKNYYTEYLTKNSHFTDFSEEKEFIVYKTPGCGGCNKKLKMYLDTIPDANNINLIYVVKYPNQETLNFWKKKFKGNFFLDQSDILNQMNSDIIRSGKIWLIGKKVKFKSLNISDDVVQFMKK
ncbi:MAG: hypothetical protein ACPGVD_09730 [Flavobacteriales bacterium]